MPHLRRPKPRRAELWKSDIYHNSGASEGNVNQLTMFDVDKSYDICP
jgi:hypothetical protein